MTHMYRCSDRRNCGARKTLRQRIERYILRPLCPGCGKDTLKSVDKKERERTKQRMCRCDGAWFPHRKGSLPLCIHNEAPIDEDKALEQLNQMIRRWKG